MTPFLIFATQRSGSTFFVEALRREHAVRCLFEVLNDAQYPRWLGAQLNFTSHSDAMRQLPIFMSHFWSDWCPSSLEEMVACGFKVLADHLRPPAHLDQLFQSGSPRVILLERSDARAQYASLSRAFATGEWGFEADVATKQQVCQPADEECKHRVAAAFSWTPGAGAAGSFKAFLRAREAWHSNVRRAATRAGSPLLLVHSESLNDTHTLNATMTRVLRFLRRPAI